MDKPDQLHTRDIFGATEAQETQIKAIGELIVNANSSNRSQTKTAQPECMPYFRHHVEHGFQIMCCCCMQWLSANDDPYMWRAGESGRYYCKDCIREGRKPQIKAEACDVTNVIPPEYADASLNGLPANIRARLLQWPSKTPFVAIYGCPGSRKTTSARWVHRAMAHIGKPVLWLDAPKAREQWANAMRRDRVTEAWETTPLLILDDLSACAVTEGWAAVVHNLIDQRLNYRRPLLITTAANSKSLAAQYGEAVGSRLWKFEPWIHLPQKDWRKQCG